MSEQLCPLCGGSGAERTEERRITQMYAELAAAAVRELDALRERDALRARVEELEEALRDLCDEVEATAAASVRARRMVKREVEP